jgi:hypothetical protein
MINTTNDQYPALDRITRITTVMRASGPFAPIFTVRVIRPGCPLAARRGADTGGRTGLRTK